MSLQQGGRWEGGWEVDGRVGATHFYTHRNKNIFSAIQECCFCLAFQPSVLLFPSMRGCCYFIVISKVGVCPSLCLFSLTKRVWRWVWVGRRAGLLAQLGKCYSTRRQFIAPRHLFQKYHFQTLSSGEVHCLLTAVAQLSTKQKHISMISLTNSHDRSLLLDISSRVCQSNRSRNTQTYSAKEDHFLLRLMVTLNKQLQHATSKKIHFLKTHDTSGIPLKGLERKKLPVTFLPPLERKSIQSNTQKNALKCIFSGIWWFTQRGLLGSLQKMARPALTHTNIGSNDRI